MPYPQPMFNHPVNADRVDMFMYQGPRSQDPFNVKDLFEQANLSKPQQQQQQRSSTPNIPTKVSTGWTDESPSHSEQARGGRDLGTIGNFLWDLNYNINPLIPFFDDRGTVGSNISEGGLRLASFLPWTWLPATAAQVGIGLGTGGGDLQDLF